MALRRLLERFIKIARPMGRKGKKNVAPTSLRHTQKNKNQNSRFSHETMVSGR